MSIVSVYGTDKSNAMYKRYASLAFNYLKEPEAAKVSTSQIPLENLFRLLEMYKYDAFSDESRAGILAVKNNIDRVVMRSSSLPWQTKIVEVMDSAISEIFNDANKEEAVDDLEETLRLLYSSSDIDDGRMQRASNFFYKLSEELT